MKIENKSADQAIKNIIGSKYKCLLLYGSDNSAVNTKYSAAIDIFKNNGYEISDISPNKLKENESFLLENFLAISMFSESSLFTLRLLEKENDFTKIIENLFEKNDLKNNNNFLIVTAGDLSKTSSLKKYAEKSDLIASIACYEANMTATNSFINNKLKEFGFIFNNDVVMYLNNNIGNNTLSIENEIKKLDLYKGDDRKLTFEDVKNCVKNISQIDLSDFCNSFCNIEYEKTFVILDKIIQENIEVIVIIRTLVTYFLQLQRISFRVKNGESMESIVEKEIFWKQRDSTKTHLRRWNLSKINDMLEKLMIIEKTAKFSSNSTELKDFVLKCFMKFGR